MSQETAKNTPELRKEKAQRIADRDVRKFRIMGVRKRASGTRPVARLLSSGPGPKIAAARGAPSRYQRGGGEGPGFFAQHLADQTEGHPAPCAQ